jgi:Ocular albinism type 1 protein
MDLGFTRTLAKKNTFCVELRTYAHVAYFLKIIIVQLRNVSPKICLSLDMDPVFLHCHLVVDPLLRFRRAPLTQPAQHRRRGEVVSQNCMAYSRSADVHRCHRLVLPQRRVYINFIIIPLEFHSQVSSLNSCHAVHDTATAAMRVLPNYLVTYLPIVAVMLINPILYRYSSKEIDRQLVSRFSQITAQERQIMNKFKMKFVMITVVFYVCWMPNIINGIVLWSAWYQLPVKFVIVNWYLMAILNPLQAFFNALVYRKWDCTFKITELKSPVVRFSVLLLS